MTKQLESRTEEIEIEKYQCEICNVVYEDEESYGDWEYAKNGAESCESAHDDMESEPIRAVLRMRLTKRERCARLGLRVESCRTAIAEAKAYLADPGKYPFYGIICGTGNGPSAYPTPAEYARNQIAENEPLQNALLKRLHEVEAE